MSSSRKNAQTWPHMRHARFEEMLHQSNAAWFAERGFNVNPRLPYLLERWEDWPKNIVLPEVVHYIQAEKLQRRDTRDSFPLHKYLHHGLSSQAMLFNLVGPLAVSSDLTPLHNAFETAGVHWPVGDCRLVFEVENRKVFNEDSGQPTSLDLVIQSGASERSLYIEAKLVEREFGGCTVFAGGDCDGQNPSGNFERCYLHHLGRLYWTLLEKHGFLTGPAGIGPICPLAAYYQFFREVLFAIEAGGDFVLLYDQRNPSFISKGSGGKRGLIPFLLTFVPNQHQTRVHTVTIQEVVKSYHQSGSPAWLADFEKRYAL